MRLLVSIDSWAARLLSVMALAPAVGCDGNITSGETSSGSAGGTSVGGAGGSSSSGAISAGGAGGSSSSGATSVGGAGGSSSSGATSVGSAGGSSSGDAPFPCDDPEPIVVAGQDTGYVRCAGGWMHRAEVVTCPSAIPRATACQDKDPSGAPGSCSTDADCTDQPNGYCKSAEGGEALPGCFCAYGCTTDADCGEGQICLCGDPVGQCVPASCESDKDCGSLLCSSHVLLPGCGGTGFACQTPSDECASDEDCAGDMQCSLEAGKHACSEQICAIGRPFLVDGVVRTAAPAARDDWRAGPAADLGAPPRLDALSAGQRAALAEHWTRAALLEHASIAAFARFALQLLSLGAPPGLVAATQAAMGDEAEHARLCFELASAFGGRDVGPGPLAIDGALGGADAREILVTAVREGCIGETVAAIEAAEAALHATDPAVRRALEKIAEDESRHAELAFRFAAWAIERDPALASVLLEEIASATGAPAAGEAEDGGPLLGFGVLSPWQRRAIRERALSQVVAPCARALLARASHGGGRRAPRPPAGPRREEGDLREEDQREEIESFATKS
ncbi:ferritin-like domain-containing protein [Sorangium sp. So ce1036]|uniref:ferritin-like domain-containing protein n=1 Tax=Sorangium sp. So ce1036 TaxID=3133328 RepID=UPI003F05AA2A